MKKIVAIFLFGSQVLFGQNISSEQIDSLVKVSMEMMPQAGLAVAIVKDGKVVHAKGYGVSSVKTKEKVDENTLFCIASNSKSFTATALGILVDEGKLKWTDKVIDYLPEFKMYDPYLTANFNIQDLLTHRSGLGLGAGDLMWFPDGNDFTINEVLANFQYQKPITAFRTGYAYNNLMFIAAGELVARISGMPWSEFVETRIMKPLGMTRTAGLYKNLKDDSNVAFPHNSEHGKVVQLAKYEMHEKDGSAAGIVSSVNDMTKWLMLNLNDGKYGENLENQLVSTKSLSEIKRPHINQRFNAKPNDPTKNHYRAYGLGWGIKDINGYTVFSHTGGLPGMLSHTILVPEINFGLVVLTNASPGGLGLVTIPNEILESYTGVEGRNWVAWADSRIKNDEAEADSVLDYVWDVVAKANKKDINIDDYIGTYKDKWFGDITIEREKKKLIFTSIRSPKLTGEMMYYQDNTFAIKWKYDDMECSTFAHFTMGNDDGATTIKMEGISPDIDFSFDFHHLYFIKIK
ncbi:MAG: serine hydrolase [Flavobacteriales bacterium]|nr:serine hydrolase [Flavobacteriales bacterium]